MPLLALRSGEGAHGRGHSMANRICLSRRSPVRRSLPLSCGSSSRRLDLLCGSPFSHPDDQRPCM